MESNKQDAAASSNPADDLDAALEALRLSDSSSSPLQPWYLRPTSEPLLRPLQAPQQELAPTASSDEQRPREFQILRQPRLCEEGESSTNAGHVSPRVVGSPGGVSIQHYGEHGLRRAAPGLSYPPVAPIRSQLSASTEALDSAQSHQPMAQRSSTPRSNASQYQLSASNPQPRLYEEGESSTRAGYVGSPGGVSIPHYVEHDLRFATLGLPYPPVAEAQIQSQLRASASQYQPSPCYPQPGAAADLFVAASRLRGYGAFNPYAYAFAHQSAQALQEFRANLLRSQDPMVYAMFSQSSEKVVQLLAAGDEEVLRLVLAAVNHRVYDVMKSSEMHAVFLALLRVCDCERRLDELRSIAQAAASSNGLGFLMAAAENHYGETALKELIRAVAPHRRPCQKLIKCLLDERLMLQHNGAALLQHFFATLPYEDCVIIIQFAISNFHSLRSCEIGTMCLEECFMAARNSELNDLEKTIWSSTSVLAKGKYSLFLQRIFKFSSELLKERIRERIVADLVDLCVHGHGNYVVKAYFLRKPSRGLLELVFPAFLGLSDYKLAELVRGEHSNYVVRKLLGNGQDVMECWAQTRALAMRIERLPAEVLELENARKVMRVVRNVLPRN